MKYPGRHSGRRWCIGYCWLVVVVVVVDDDVVAVVVAVVDFSDGDGSRQYAMHLLHNQIHNQITYCDVANKITNLQQYLSNYMPK